MRRTSTLSVLVAFAVCAAAIVAHARGPVDRTIRPAPLPDHRTATSWRGALSDGARTGVSAATRDDPSTGFRDTLWIFDSDFEEHGGHNDYWVTHDMSGTLPNPNYWHKHLPFGAGAFPHLGLNSWWCGAAGNPCWMQPQGYGNRWTECLERHFELAEWSTGSDAVTFEFDQRFAMEHNYDYGYVDVVSGPDTTWTTVASYTNPGFYGDPGMSQDWDSFYGHQVLDMSAYAGSYVSVRFRFESDEAYSSSDEPNNPPQNSCLNGAWELDNFVWRVNGFPVWSDDCEDEGDNEWMHESVLDPTGQTGVVFYRGLYGVDLHTHRDPDCWTHGGWMYGAVDPVSAMVVDAQDSWLVSPPIDISGAPRLVGQWEMWVDCPRLSHDYYDLWLGTHDIDECAQEWNVLRDEEEGVWYGGPMGGVWSDDWESGAMIGMRSWGRTGSRSRGTCGTRRIRTHPSSTTPGSSWTGNGSASRPANPRPGGR